MTYKELLEELQKLDDSQLDLDMTVEIPWEQECIIAKLCIADNDHAWLPANYPVIVCEE